MAPSPPRDGDRPSAAGGTPVERPGPTDEPAALWRRVLARLTDMVAVFFLQFALAVILTAVGVPLRWDGAPEPWGKAFVAYVLYVVLFAAYETVFVAARGQTPGKDLCKVKVVDPATLATPSRERVLVRAVVPAVVRLVPGGYAMLGVAVLLVTGLPALVDRRRRTLSDWLAGTVVIAYDANVIEGPRPKMRKPPRTGLFRIPGLGTDDDDR